MEIIAWIVGVPIALFIAYRIFWTLSFFERGIFLGIILGIGCMLFGWSIWIGAGVGFALGSIILPIVCPYFGFDYEFLRRIHYPEKCPYCGSRRRKEVVESTGNHDCDTFIYCKDCGMYIGH